MEYIFYYVRIGLLDSTNYDVKQIKFQRIDNPISNVNLEA